MQYLQDVHMFFLEEYELGQQYKDGGRCLTTTILNVTYILLG
jgi:hypothetical protein